MGSAATSFMPVGTAALFRSAVAISRSAFCATGRSILDLYNVSCCQLQTPLHEEMKSG